MLLYFVRHGQTDDNANGIIQGHKDTHLNDHGRREAGLVAERLRDVPFIQVWTSELSRARETAEIILAHHPDLSLQSHPDLKERCLGSMEGKRWHKGWKHPDDVEPTDQFQKRVCNWVASFLDSYYASDDMALEGLAPSTSTLLDDQLGYTAILGGVRLDHFDPAEPIVLVVSHGAWMSMLFRSLHRFPFTLLPEDQMKRDCYNTSVMVLRCRKSDPRDVERRKREYKEAKTRHKEEKEAYTKSKVSTNGLLAGMSNLLRKDGSRDKRDDKAEPQPPKRIVEGGWDGELLSWGDVSHLEGLLEKDERDGKAKGRRAAKVADDIKE